MKQVLRSKHKIRLLDYELVSSLTHTHTRECLLYVNSTLGILCGNISTSNLAGFCAGINLPGDHMMSCDCHMTYSLQTNLHKLKPKLANVWRDITEKAEESVK